MRPDRALHELTGVLDELNSTPMGRRAFLAATPLLLAACASQEKTRGREGDNAGQDAALTVAQEREESRKYLAEMQKDYPPIQDPEIQNYVKGLGAKIVAANGLEGNPYNYSFSVVDVTYVNAFALPAGTIFVTAPLLQMADTEAELAGVVGHEIGHVKARHTAERIAKMEREKNKGLLYGIGGGVLGAAAGFGLGNLLCPPKDKKCLTQAAALGAAAGAGAGLMIHKYPFMQNSQEDEFEADRIGFRTSVAAGFSKDHAGLFYSKLQKMEDERKSKGVPILSSFADAFSTHPPSRERVDEMNKLVAAAPANAKALVSSAAFEKARKRVESHIKASAGKAPS